MMPVPQFRVTSLSTSAQALSTIASVTLSTDTSLAANGVQSGWYSSFPSSPHRFWQLRSGGPDEPEEPRDRLRRTRHVVEYKLKNSRNSLKTRLLFPWPESSSQLVIAFPTRESLQSLHDGVRQGLTPVSDHSASQFGDTCWVYDRVIVTDIQRVVGEQYV